MVQARNLVCSFAFLLLVASGCGGSPDADAPVASEEAATSSNSTSEPSGSGADEADPATDASSSEAAPDASGDETADEPDSDGETDSDGEADTGDGVQTTEVESRDGYEVVTITPGNGEDPVSFVVSSPSDYGEQTCRAIDAWYDQYNDNFNYEMQPGTSVEALTAASISVDAAAGGELGVYFAEWTDNIARQQAVVDAAGSAELPGEAVDEIRRIESELRIFDEEAIRDRETHWCGPARSGGVRPNKFEDVVFEAPDAIAYTSGQAVDYEALQISVVGIEASWVDPLHVVGLQDEYGVAQDPSVFVVLEVTNTSDQVYEWNSLTPVQLIAPRREAFRAASLYDREDPNNPGLPFDPGEVRTVTYAFDLNVGYLQVDGIRSLPSDLGDWALRFNSSESWTFVELGGRVARGVINGSGAPWPDIDPSFYDDAPNGSTTTEDSESVEAGSGELDAESQEELENTLALLQAFVELDEEELACMRVELTQAFLVLDEDTATDADFLAIITACDVQRKAVRSNVSIAVSETVGDCVYEALNDDEAEAVLTELIGLDATATQGVLDDLVTTSGCG